MERSGEPFTFVYDYNQLYLYDAALDLREGNAYLDALDAMTEAGLTVGACSDVVDVLMPRQDNFGAIIEVRPIANEPATGEDADHVVEFDLQLSSGHLVLEGSGGSGTATVAIPPGTYRARLTGTHFDAAAAWRYEETGNPGDRYLLELWPTTDPRPPVELRRWPGYADRL